jgi:hypothetical protein
MTVQQSVLNRDCEGADPTLEVATIEIAGSSEFRIAATIGFVRGDDKPMRLIRGQFPPGDGAEELVGRSLDK